MAVCTVDGCEREATRRRRTWCEMHYYRARRTGTTELIQRTSPKGRPIKAQRRQRGQCSVEGCELIDAGPHRMCAKHWTRVQRHGSPDVVIHQRDRNLPRRERSRHWTGDDASYFAIHQRLRYQRGPARTHVCVDCGNHARQWSYQRTGGPSQRESPEGPYSVDLDDYVPRCVPCHKKFDLAHLGRTTIKENHA